MKGKFCYTQKVSTAISSDGKYDASKSLTAISSDCKYDAAEDVTYLLY